MDYYELTGDTGKEPDFTEAARAGQELLRIVRGWREGLGAERGLLDQYLAGILRAMTDTTNAHLTARDGFESALALYRGLLCG